MDGRRTDARSAAASFLHELEDAAALPRRLVETREKVPRASAGFVFLTGTISGAIEEVAAKVAQAWPGVPTVIATGAGVLAEQGEIEGKSAVSGMLIAGGSAAPIVARAESPEELPGKLADAIEETARGLLVLFAQPSGWTSQALAHPTVAATTILGGGTAGEIEPAVVLTSGEIQRGAVAGLCLRGVGVPHIKTSPACRMLGEIGRITEARGAMLLGIDDQPALDVLSRAAGNLDGRPLVMALLPPDEISAEDLARSPLRAGRVRPIRGVDPTRRAVMLGEPVRVGQRCGFVALDAKAARADMETMVRDIARESGGAAARFGLYVSCAGRGQGLYGGSDVDGRILRARFSGMPYAGMMSTFELAPSGKTPSMHFYTGVFGLFSTPS